MQLHRLNKPCAILFLIFLLSGCSTVSYYSQAVGGHLKLMTAREPIDKLLASDDTDPTLKAKLQTLVDARQFAIDRLELPENESYNTYAATGRRYVTWNVVAAEEFSLRAKTWCFPVAGCVSYKGYFAEEDAKAYADELLEENLDVNIGGATAYSTLGWFDDPVLDTMLNGGDIRYVGTLFHELAHQVLYVKDDSNFNEAFASFVEQEGLRIWLNERDQTDRIELYNAILERSEGFNALLKKTRGKLVSLYNEAIADELKREKKQGVFDDMQNDYKALKASWDGYSGYDGWFAREVNNARLISVATYRKFIPAFAAMYVDVDRDLPAFYEIAKQVANLQADKRREVMAEYLARDVLLSSP